MAQSDASGSDAPKAGVLPAQVTPEARAKRPVVPGHLHGLVDLNELCGFPRRSVAGWDWVLFQNPEQEDHPSGFVFEKNGQVIAFAGTLLKRLHRGDETRRLIVGHTLLTDLTSPGNGFKIAAHALKSCRADIVATLNNNALSAALYPRIGMMPFLGEEGQCFAEYVLRPITLAVGLGLRRLHRSADRAAYDRLSEHFCLTGLSLESLKTIEDFELIDAGNEADAAALDEFNLAMKDGEYFEPDRGARVTAYRLADPDAPRSMKLFALRSAGMISALMALSIAKDSKLSPPVLEIEDLVVRPGNDALRTGCLNAAVEAGRRIGASKVRLRYVKGLAGLVGPLRGWALRKHAYSPIHAVGRESGLMDEWAVGPASGDFFFALRRQVMDRS